MSYLNSLVAFPTFFNFSLHFAIRNWWSEPGFVFADCIELLHLQLQRIESIWFQWCPYSVISFVVGRGCFVMTSAFSWKNYASFCPASFCSPSTNLSLASGISWIPTFALQYPRMKRTSVFFCLFVLVLESLIGLPKITQFHVFGITGWGIDLDCYDVEWVGLETN